MKCLMCIIEEAYWDFDSSLKNRKSYSDRDLYKFSVRKLIRKIKSLSSQETA